MGERKTGRAGFIPSTPDLAALVDRVPLARECPLALYREGLALCRQARVPWFDAEDASAEAALRAAPPEERDEWQTVLRATRRTWHLAYQRRDLGLRGMSALVSLLG